MDEFADYILSEEDLISKIEIIYFLAPKLKINFDKSIIFKTEIARMFLKYANPKVDFNLVLTACLLCNCKKVDDAQKIGKIKTYAREGAEYLAKLGFDERFCKICEGVNRYSGNPREGESDILELADQFGGMLIDRAERIGFSPDEALVLLEHRNLKSAYNRYLETFREFAEKMDTIEIPGNVNTTIFARLQKLMRESKDVPEFVKNIAEDYSICVDEKLKELEEIAKSAKETANRAMFTSETEEKVRFMVEIAPRKNRTYFTYLRCKNFLSADSRPGAYFGMTLSIDGLYCCKDTVNLYKLFDQIYTTYIANGTIVEKRQDKEVYLVSAFAEKASKLEEVNIYSNLAISLTNIAVFPV